MAESDSGEDLEARVRAWVERSGFALELRVAREFARAKAIDVTPSRSYFEEDFGVWREIDVVARFEKRRDPGRRLVVVAECKDPKRRQPWVIFTDQRRYLSDDESFQRQRHMCSSTDMAREAWASMRGSIALPTNAPGYSIAEAMRDHTSGGGEEGPNVPFRAVRQAAAAADRLSHDFGSFPEGQWMQFVVPIVVTTAPLFECRLGTRANVVTSSVQHAALWVQPDRPILKSRTHGWVIDSVPPVMVQVMSEDFLRSEWARAAWEAANLM